MDLSIHDKAVLNIVFNPSLPLTEAYQDENIEELIDIEDDITNLEHIKEQEIEAINKAEIKEYDVAICILTNALKLEPKKASLYNNRAQVYQLMGKIDEAYDDLSKAITLGQEKQRKSVCQALCQRGMIHRKYDRLGFAKEDFEAAASMGSKFAKSQLVEMNPYAALCNQMLRKVMDELK